jgi:hypothetical protein
VRFHFLLPHPEAKRVDPPRGDVDERYGTQWLIRDLWVHREESLSMSVRRLRTTVSMRNPRVTLYAFLHCLATACSSAHDPQGAPAMPEGGVTGPGALPISVAFASAHLGVEGCTQDESGGLTVRSCAILPADAGPRGTGPCGGQCDFSNVQLSLSSESIGSVVHVQIGKVALLDAATGTELQTLSAYTPVIWNGTQYVAWDESVAPSSQVKASYTLSPPAWSTLDPSFSYSHQYKVRIEVDAGGATVVLESPPVTRPAPFAT